MKLTETPYGFDYGPAKVTRCMSDGPKGWVVIAVETAKHDQRLQIYVTKTGKVRVHKNGVELLPKEEA